MPQKELLLCGLLAGCVFWIKFTIIGIPAGLALSVLLPFVLHKRWRQAFQSLGWLVMGAFLSTVPWLIYFGLNGAIYDWLRVYLGHNLFLYNDSEALSLAARIKSIVRLVAAWLGRNWGYTPLIAAGPLWLTLRRRQKGMAPAAWLALGFGGFFVFFSAKEYPYYGLALAGLVPLGMSAIASWLEPRLERLAAKRSRLGALCAAMSLLCVGLCLLGHNIRPTEGCSFGEDRADTMAYQIAAAMKIDEDTTLLNLGFMDAGFYTAAGIAPNTKYFCQNNVPLNEMRSEQRRYVAEQLCQYVVSRMQDDALFQQYDLITQVPSPNFWYPQVYLYRLRAEYR